MVVSSSRVTQPLCIYVESLRLTPDCLPTNVNGAAAAAATAPLIGVKLGLYHGAKRLSPTVVHYFNQNQAINAKKVRRLVTHWWCFTDECFRISDSIFRWPTCPAWQNFVSESLRRKRTIPSTRCSGSMLTSSTTGNKDHFIC